MRKWLVLMVMVTVGLMFLGAGCAKPNSIEASDQTPGTSITVTWVWVGSAGSGGNVVKPDHYLIFRSDNAISGFTQIANVKKSPYSDTAAGASKIWFYKVQAIPKTGGGSDLSWAEGGSTSGSLVNDADVGEKVAAWEKDGNCIHWWTEKYYGATPTPPIHDNWAGDTGNLKLDMFVDTSSGLDAVADFEFQSIAGHGYSSTCTNDRELVGLQHGVVSVPGYDGTLRGSIAFEDGWINYHLEVTDKHSSGGHFYAYDADTAKTSWVDLSYAPWGACVDRCDDTTNCCP